MTGTLDRLIEEFLRGLIIAEVPAHIQVVTSLMGEGEAAATLPRIVIECQSQETPEFFEVGVHRIVTQISSIAEATSPVSSDDLEEMNTAVDRVIVFGDNLTSYLTSQDVVTHGVVYGGEVQQTQGNKLIRVRSAEIWARLLNANPLQSQIPILPDTGTQDIAVTISPPPQFGLGFFSALNLDLGTATSGTTHTLFLNLISNLSNVTLAFVAKGTGRMTFSDAGATSQLGIGPSLLQFIFGGITYNATAVGLKNLTDAGAGADIASAATTNIGAATGEYINITGNATITALGSAPVGALRECTLTGTPTFTHHATDLILPGNANIVGAAGDVIAFRSINASGKWKCTNYQRQAIAP